MAALALMLLGSGTAPALHDDEDHPKDFPATLHRVLRAARERFRPLQGFRVEMRPGRTYWFEPKVLLPGAARCRIFEHPRASYVCEWDRGVTLAALAEKVAGALGEEWQRTDRPQKIVAFTQNEWARAGTVELSQTGRQVQLAIYPATD